MVTLWKVQPIQSIPNAIAFFFNSGNYPSNIALVTCGIPAEARSDWAETWWAVGWTLAATNGVAAIFWLARSERVVGEIGPDRLIPWPVPPEYVNNYKKKIRVQILASTTKSSWILNTESMCTNYIMRFVQFLPFFIRHAFQSTANTSSS